MAGEEDQKINRIITKDNTGHYTWGKECDGWHLLKSDALSVIMEKMPPGTTEVLHYHEKAQQLFYILSGTADLEVEGIEYIIRANECMHVKPGLKHKIKNSAKEDLHFLVISAPESHGDRINC